MCRSESLTLQENDCVEVDGVYLSRRENIIIISNVKSVLHAFLFIYKRLHCRGAMDDEEDKSLWCQPQPLNRVMHQAPVLVRLEEGHRGEVDSLSFSQGDTMALEGVTEVDECPVLMAHYVDEGGEEGPFRALLSIPLHNLPDIEVRKMRDPDRSNYSNFVAKHFAHLNWTQQQKDILKRMQTEDTRDYINVPMKMVEPKPHTSTPSHMESWKLPKTAPKTLPKPKHAHRLVSQALTLPPEQQVPKLSPRPPAELPTGQRSPPPPPRPPRPTTDSPPPSHPAPVPPSPQTPKHFSTLPPRPTHASPPFNTEPADTPPARPPKSSHLIPKATSSSSHEEELAPAFDFTFAELASVKKEGALDDSEYLEPLPSADITYLEKHNTTEKTKSNVYVRSKEMFKSIITLGKKATLSKIPSQSPSSPSTPTLQSPDPDSDSDSNYDVIDELQLDPKYDAASKTKGKKSAPGGQISGGKTQGKNTATVKPTVRSTTQAGGGEGSIASRSPSERPKMPHPMMQSGSASNVYEAVDGSPLQSMSCSELCERLQICGMHGLARACQSKSLDGAFFMALSDKALKKAPFNLDDFDISNKMKMIKAGWVPR